MTCTMCAPLSEGRVYVGDSSTDLQALVVDFAEDGALYFTATGWDRPRGVRGLDRVIRSAIEDRFPGATVVDTTKGFGAVAETESTIFVIRPNAGSPTVKRTVESIVKNAAGGQRLDRYGSGIEIDVHTPNRFSRRDAFVVRVSRWNDRVDSPYRSVIEEIAEQLAGAFGEENIVRHVTPEQIERIL